MTSSSTIRNEVSKLAQQIETLARRVQDQITQGGDVIVAANELARNSSTFVFTLGEMYAIEESGKKTKTINMIPVSTLNNPLHKKFHNVRDSLGRFTRKV
ncbi:MAG TPA: hypothetical protein VII94_06240 [Candidatus Saccharimonadales bacterium]